MLHPQPKPRPHLLTKYDRQAKRDQIDRAERAKCRARSGGGCEVITVHDLRSLIGRAVEIRCIHRASQNHHLIGGIGRRNRGKSILAAHRLDVCDWCHTEINHAVLRPVDGTKKEDAATVRYERVR